MAECVLWVNFQTLLLLLLLIEQQQKKPKYSYNFASARSVPTFGSDCDTWSCIFQTNVFSSLQASGTPEKFTRVLFRQTSFNSTRSPLIIVVRCTFPRNREKSGYTNTIIVSWTDLLWKITNKVNDDPNIWRQLQIKICRRGVRTGIKYFDILQISQRKNYFLHGYLITTENQLSWKDIEIYYGGKKIYVFRCKFQYLSMIEKKKIFCFCLFVYYHEKKSINWIYCQSRL